MRDAEHTQGAVVCWRIRRLRRGQRGVVCVADRNMAEWIGGDGQWQRDRGEKQDLTPDGKQRCGEPDHGFQPLGRNSFASLQHLPHEGSHPVGVERIVVWRTAGKPRPNGAAWPAAQLLIMHAVILPLPYSGVMIITTPRVRLRCWRAADRDAFAVMNGDPEVMLDQGGPLSRQKSNAKLDRYVAAYRQHGFCRWVVESREGEFLGYTGIMPSPPEHPLGPHVEIGWRLVRRAWGHGYATAAAGAAIKDAFERAGLTEVLAYTAPDNVRSQAVMTRLHLRRDTSRDFTADYDSIKAWRGLVWVARRRARPVGPSIGTPDTGRHCRGQHRELPLLPGSVGCDFSH